MASEQSQEDIVLEPLSLSDIKWTMMPDEGGKLVQELNESDGSQAKYFSVAMGLTGSKRKREASISSLAHQKQVQNWRHALMKARVHHDPWERFHIEEYPTEKAHRHRYNALKKEWFVDDVDVKMQTEPFARGAMRQCFRMKKLSNFSHNQEWGRDSNNAVAKRFLDPVDREVYFSEVKLQMDAKLWGEEYNRHNPPKKVDFFMMGVLEFIDRPDRPLYHLENYIEGEYVKYNSNSGFVLGADASWRQTPQAFSHFTFERSGHEIMVVDVQGVGDLYTDPQIHTSSGLEYGDGNLGTRGMALFFHSHVCNKICASLGLTQFDLSPSELAALSGSQTPDSGTVARGSEELCVLPSQYQRTHLTEFLRMRSSSSIGSCTSLSEGAESIGEWTSADIADDDTETNESDSGVQIRSRLMSSGEKSLLPDSVKSAHSGSDSVPCRRQRLASEANSASEEADRLAFRQLIERKARSSCVVAEVEARKSLWQTENDDSQGQLKQRTGGSTLGQIHLDLAKYHEMDRFVKPNQEGYDKEAALFHLKHAADCGNLEAIITMARIALQLPHDVLPDLEMEESLVNTDLGLDYMHIAALAGDRGAMVYLAKAYDTGIGLGSRPSSWVEAARWYEQALASVETSDEEGLFDGTADDPPYQLLARLGEMHRSGGHGLEADPSKAAELFSGAADAAMAAMKGRLANRYYALAEEMNALIE